MEKEELLERWLGLFNRPGNVIASRDVLQERLIILHRLNELGEKDIEGVSIVEALEKTNVLMREIDRAKTPG